jgi:4-hydroxybenzoate polyprenyltransferase
MSAAAFPPRYARSLRHFARTRAVEVLALQASPLLGLVLGGYRPGRDGYLAASGLLLGSLALTAHIFVFNDWAGHASDLRDPRRADQVFSRQGIGRGEVAAIAACLLALALAALAAAGREALFLGIAIAALGLLYSASPVLGKATPVASTLNHVAGGILHFLLGYSLVRPVDARGLCIGLFFGLVFAGGHLNQEVRDVDGDLLNGIHTNAAVFGRRRVFLASVFTFLAAYAMLGALAFVGWLPRLLLASPLAGLLHLVWCSRALRSGLGFDAAVWMQRRYRCLFALIGLAMAVG